VPGDLVQFINTGASDDDLATVLLESESLTNNLNINHECVEVFDDFFTEHSVLADASEADLIELISTDDIVHSAWIQTLNDNFDNPGQQQQQHQEQQQQQQQQQQPLANTSYTEHCSDQSTTFDSVIQQHPDISDFFNNPQQQQVAANNHDEQPLFTLTAVLPSSNKKRPFSSLSSSSSSSSSSSEEDLDQGASPGKKLKKSDSERCREYRERKKKEKQSDDEELRSLEIKNYCLHHSHEEMQRKIVKYRQLVKIIAIQAGISHPISPDLRQRINQAVKNAIFDIGFSF